MAQHFLVQPRARLRNSSGGESMHAVAGVTLQRMHWGEYPTGLLAVGTWNLHRLILSR